MSDDGRNQDNASADPQRFVEDMIERHRRADEVALKTVFLDAAMLDIEDLANAD